MEKNILKSKTFWLAIIPVVIGVLNWIQGDLTAGLPLTGYGLLAVIVRLITKDEVYIPGLKK